ncbi:MAG: regulatory iron-sulfur-containing complex subunit RicT [Melioribacteraceae bacterium]|nr:regulatory iron-sulfur-containing complex subunit RicT [Melioribacteraceae bacterium]
MTEKDLSEENSSTYLSNDLIDDKYNNLVFDKIAKELNGMIKINCCDSCEENQEDIPKYNTTRNIIIAQCKGLLGIHFCENGKNINVNINDNIILKINSEYEFATVIQTGEMVNFRMDKSDSADEILPLIDRIATEKDFERHCSNISNTCEAKTVFLKLVNELSLEMKLVDIHFQFDRKKLFFFYTADGRVDFRELAKRLASKFKTRIELRQIGVRDEAKRIGGLATCGREFCCTSFMNNFKRITTDIALENNISTSISKYTGPCGKLKCCLSFELE